MEDLILIKQVIVIRKDLKMRRGKEIAQGAHASMAFLTKKIKKAKELGKEIDFNLAEQIWINTLFTKIVLQIGSEGEIKHLHETAISLGLESNLIEDAGLTEFMGVPTLTALAIGPDDSDRIDKITKI